MPGSINIEADKQSRVLEDATELELSPALSQKIATTVNKQIDRYVSWHPESEVMAINVFSLT